jgi:ribosomal protein L37E
MNRLNFIKTMFGGAVALIGLTKFVQACQKQLVLADLVRMRDQGLTISREDFRNAFLYENKHRAFAACSGCGAKTFEQHKTSCSRATVLVEPDWYEELQRRKASA